MLTGLAVAAASGSGGGSSYAPLLLVIVIFGGLMWLMTSRGRKQQRQQLEMRSNLAEGDEVMTTGGLFATVVSAEGDVVVLETAPGVQQRWLRQAVSRKVTEPPAEPVSEADDAAPTSIDEADIDEFEVPDDLSELSPDDGKDDKRP